MSTTHSGQENEPQLIEQKYYAYNDLTWERLEKWLTDKFPDRAFAEDKVLSRR
jgi:hypothetical protein